LHPGRRGVRRQGRGTSCPGPPRRCERGDPLATQHHVHRGEKLLSGSFRQSARIGPVRWARACSHRVCLARSSETFRLDWRAPNADPPLARWAIPPLRTEMCASGLLRCLGHHTVRRAPHQIRYSSAWVAPRQEDQRRLRARSPGFGELEVSDGRAPSSDGGGSECCPDECSPLIAGVSDAGGPLAKAQSNRWSMLCPIRNARLVG